MWLQQYPLILNSKQQGQESQLTGAHQMAFHECAEEFNLRVYHETTPVTGQSRPLDIKSSALTTWLQCFESYAHGKNKSLLLNAGQTGQS